MSDGRKALFLVILVALLSAGNSPVQKIGISVIPPLTFAFLRFFLSSLIILPLLVRGRKTLIKDLYALWPMTLFASINIIVFILGLKLTTATIAQFLYAGGPLLTGVIGWKFLSQRLIPRTVAGIIVGFMGIAVVILLPIIEEGKKFSGDLMGNILIGMGVVCYSIYLVLSKKTQKEHSPLVINNAFIVITTILLFPLFMVEVRAYPAWWENIAFAGIVSLIYIVIFGTVSMWLATQYAIRHGGSLITSMNSYLIPIFTFILAYILLGEGLTTGLAIGGALALLGVFLVTSK